MDLFIAIFQGIIIASTPLVLAAVGELVVEKSGVLNLGVEGMMIIGAPYSIDALHQTKSGGTPYGASHVNTAGPVLTDDERAIAEAAGKRLAHTIKQVT